jgi:hypothetical protein
MTKGNPMAANRYNNLTVPAGMLNYPEVISTNSITAKHVAR